MFNVRDFIADNCSEKDLAKIKNVIESKNWSEADIVRKTGIFKKLNIDDYLCNSVYAYIRSEEDVIRLDTIKQIQEFSDSLNFSFESSYCYDTDASEFEELQRSNAELYYYNNFLFSITYYDNIDYELVCLEKSNFDVDTYLIDIGTSYINSKTAYRAFTAKSNYLIDDFLENLKDLEESHKYSFDDIQDAVASLKRIVSFNDVCLEKDFIIKDEEIQKYLNKYDTHKNCLRELDKKLNLIKSSSSIESDDLKEELGLMLSLIQVLDDFSDKENKIKVYELQEIFKKYDLSEKFNLEKYQKTNDLYDLLDNHKSI